MLYASSDRTRGVHRVGCRILALAMSAAALISCGSDAAQSSATDAGVAPPDDAAEAAPAEVCNFKDDNGDGQVDEGFRWVVRPPKHVWTTTRFAIQLKALPLADGSVAVMVVDGVGEPTDRIAVLRVSPTGALEGNPTMLETPLSGPKSTGFGLVDDSTLGVISGSEDYAGCTAGCPVTFDRLGSTDLSLKDERVLDFGFPVGFCGSLACASGSCATVAVDASTTAPHLIWFDPDTGSVKQDRTLPGNYGTPALAGSDAVAWVSGTKPDQAGNPTYVNFGVWSLDGATQLLAPREVYATASGTDLAPAQDLASVRWLGSNLLLSMSAVSSTASSVLLTVRSRDGNDVADSAVGGAGIGAVTGVGVGANVLAATVVKPFGVDLHRLQADLKPVNAPGNPIEVDTGAVYLELVPTGQSALLITANYDGRSVDSWEVACP